MWLMWWRGLCARTWVHGEGNLHNSGSKRAHYQPVTRLLAAYPSPLLFHRRRLNRKTLLDGW